MADVAVLALGLDASQMKTGGDQANRVLDSLQARFQQAEQRINSLKNQLQGSGTTIKTTSEHWREFGNSARNALGTLSGLGGPIGNVAGKVEQLGGQLASLVNTFGLVGGGATALAAALAAAASAFVGLSIKGAKAADEMLDISEATGLTIDQVQRLGAAMQRSGEDVSGVERAFKKFQDTVQTAIDDPTSKAATSLRRLGVVATDAGRDTGKAFINTLAQLKELRTSTEGAAASNEVFGRGIGALVRGSSELQRILGSTRAELQATGIIASDLALGAAADLDSQMNRLTQSFNTFTIQLNGLGAGVANTFFNDLADALETVNGWLDSISKSPFWTLVIAGVTAIPSLVTPGGSTRRDSRPDTSVGPFGGPGITLRDPIIPEPPKPTVAKPTPAIQPSSTLADLNAANRAAKEFYEGSRKVAEVFYATQITDFQQYTARMTQLDEGFREAQISNARQVQAELEAQLSRLTPGTENFKRVNDELSKVKLEVLELAQALGIVVLPEIGKFIERLKDFNQVTLPLGRIPDITGTRPRTVGAPHPDDIPLDTARRPRIVNEKRAADRDRINQEFSFVFEDFIFQIASGRKKLGQAFAGFALGMVDVFASEFARAFQKSLQKAFISPLANWLEGALTEIFSGISGKGIGKFFGGLFKSVFSGFFAEGGTIPANHFGVVGERGPELAFAGSQPMTITPFGSGGGGNSVSVTFHVNAPGGSLDRRSMDQMSEQVLRAVERGTRNRGV